MQKEKSKLNKTIVITDEDRERLRPLLSESPKIDTITCGDMWEQLMKIPDGTVDLIIADPPYNLDKQFGNTKFSSMSEENYEKYLRTWMQRLTYKLKDNGTIYICCDWKCSSSIYKVMSECVDVINRITWDRAKGRGASKNWKNNTEDIWMGVMNKNDYTFNLDAVKVKKKVLTSYHNPDGSNRDWYVDENGEKYRMTCPSNIWTDITVPFWSMPENTEHPTQKPEKLIAKLILASSNPGDLVLDPFVGSGTTCVVAKKLGRHYMGIEKEEDYSILSLKRLEMASSDARIQGFDGECFTQNGI